MLASMRLRHLLGAFIYATVTKAATDDYLTVSQQLHTQISSHLAMQHLKTNIYTHIYTQTQTNQHESPLHPSPLPLSPPPPLHLSPLITNRISLLTVPQSVQSLCP